MASAIYPKAKEALLSADIDLTADTIKIALLTAAYTYSSSHQYRSSITAATVATSTALSSVSVTNGVFDAADITLTAVTTGYTVTAIAIYKDTGSSATDPLIAYIDGMSQATNGGDIAIAWDNGSNKIFAL